MWCSAAMTRWVRGIPVIQLLFLSEHSVNFLSLCELDQGCNR